MGAAYGNVLENIKTLVHYGADLAQVRIPRWALAWVLKQQRAWHSKLLRSIHMSDPFQHASCPSC